MFLALVLLVVSLIPYIIIGLVVLVFGRKQNLKKDYSYHPTITVFLPTFNEEKYIAKKLDNLLQQTYPIDEILIYDCSDDGTREIIREYQKRYANIKMIIQHERVGMARTLNEAIKSAKGDIIVKTDCDSLAKSKDALRELMANFSDETTGGASGICISEGIEGWFRKFMTRLQIAESNLDSTIVAHSASLLAFRRSVAEEVDSDSMAEDTEEFVLIRKKGYKTVIDCSVVSQEEAPSTFPERRIQKDRRAQGIIGALVRNFSILFNLRYGFYGTIVFPMNFFLIVVSPFVLLMGIILVGYVLFSISQFFLIVYILASTLLIAFSYLGKLNILMGIIELQLSGLAGTIKFLTQRRNAKWARIR